MRIGNKIGFGLLALLIALRAASLLPTPDGGSAPIKVDKLTVLVVYESADALPQAQKNILTATEIRQYLDSKQADYRMIDKDVPSAGLPPTLQAALARPRQSLPWILVATPSGGTERPLPADVQTTLALLKQYGGA